MGEMGGMRQARRGLSGAGARGGEPGKPGHYLEQQNAEVEPVRGLDLGDRISRAVGGGWRRMTGLAASVLVMMSVSAAMPSLASAQVLADSSADFSGVQGSKGWWYGYYNGDSGAPWRAGDFELLSHYVPGADGASGVWMRQLGAGGWWTAINQTAAHPNGLLSTGGRRNEENWAVRRWVSPSAQPLRISGRVRDTGLGDGDGVVAMIVVNGSEVWRRELEDGDVAGKIFALEACIGAGQSVDFVLSPRGSSDRSDGTLFEATIRGPIDEQPRSLHACPGEPAVLGLAVADADSCVFQWYKDGRAIAGARAATLVIQHPTEADEGRYTCVVSDVCGDVVSRVAELVVCGGDLNCDGVVDFVDYLTYLTLFDVGEPRADLNGDAIVDFSDFLEFINVYEEGC